MTSITVSTGALVRSCHPAPSLAVTAFATVLAAAAGNSAATCAVLAVAVCTGQLTIGWSNDRIDADRDRRAGRADKPIARGELAARTVDGSIGVALLATVVASLALGWAAGLVHLGAVACGWAYNLWLKRTAWSWLPYAAAFGALPAVATLARAAPAVPAGWVIAAGALFGVVANLTNALPDLADDRADGIRGLPHRLGAGTSLLIATALVAAASALIVFGPPGGPVALAWGGLGVSLAAALGGLCWAWRHRASRSAFYGIVLVVAVNVVLIAVAGHHLR